MAKKTRWFPCSIKPVRNGLYEISLYGAPVGLCLFSGGRWRRWACGMYGGINATGSMRPGAEKRDRWRGLEK